MLAHVAASPSLRLSGRNIRRFWCSRVAFVLLVDPAWPSRFGQVIVVMRRNKRLIWAAEILSCPSYCVYLPQPAGICGAAAPHRLIRIPNQTDGDDDGMCFVSEF